MPRKKKVVENGPSAFDVRIIGRSNGGKAKRYMRVWAWESAGWIFVNVGTIKDFNSPKNRSIRLSVDQFIEHFGPLVAEARELKRIRQEAIDG